METNWPAFLVVLVVAYVIPGPDFAIILRHATRHWRQGMAAALGAQAGLCVHMVLAVLGLSVVLAQHAGALTVIRVVGGLYLVYLGGRMITSTLGRRPEETGLPAGERFRSAFRHGFMTNVTNPKALLFFASVLPQFVVAGSGPVGVQVAVLGAVDVLFGLLPWTVVVLVGARLSACLSRRRIRDWWDRITGLALGFLGGALLTKAA
jgi:threonine/homoserine/homoserine lactone efflux protein